MKFHIFPADDPRSATRAILLFAGWGMDEKPFVRTGLQGYTLIVIWDYRDSSFPPELHGMLRDFREIAVIGWSFGVPAATEFILSNPDLPVTARIAVNGTMHPVHDHLGIPTEIFRGTLEGLTEKSLSKFYLRMCGSSALFREFSETYPRRTVDELREELSAIADRQAIAPRGVWDRAVICKGDRIIPPDNQEAAWRDEAFGIIRTDAPHLPDFNSLLAALLTEKSLVAERFARAERTYDDNAVVQRRIARKLISLVPRRSATVGRALEIGCGTGMTTGMLVGEIPVADLEVWDLHLPASLPSSIGSTRITGRECDAETEIRCLPDGSLDLIFSASTMQWFNSPGSFLRECLRVLRPGGHAVISTFGPETMREISGAPARRQYPDDAAIGQMLPAGCQKIHLSSEIHTIHFPTPADALRHVSLTGVNALSRNAGGATARSVMAAYPLAPDGSAPLTYQPIYIVFGRPRHPSMYL